MRFYPTKIQFKFLYFFIFSIALTLGCAKDSDLLLDSIINEDVSSVEEKENSTPQATETEEEVAEEEVAVEEVAEEIVDEESQEEIFESRTTSFSPTNDAHYQSGKAYNQNIIRLDEGNRTSFLMFDLSPIGVLDGEITAITLQFTIDSDNGSGSINIFKAESSNWSEQNLSDTNIPQIEVQVGSILKEYKIGETEIVNLDASKLLPEISTLILNHKNGNDLAFASKEHISKIGPKLVVHYSVAEGTEEISIPEYVEEIAEEDTTGGSEDTPAEDNTPSNSEPIAIADATPSSGGVPLDVSFTGNNSSDDKAITSFSWDFKDGSSATTANPTHTYTKAGVYEAILTVTDAEGLATSDTVTITVSETANQAPNAVLSATPISGDAPLEVTFKGSSSTDDHSISSYVWNLKDGSTASNADFKHTYDEPGVYQAELTVKDENGLSDKETVTITVTEPTNTAPVAKTSANTTIGVAPLLVQFTGNNSTDDKGVTGYAWNFKDGSTASTANPSHSFENAGTYVVELTVSDKENLTHKNTITIRVQEPAAENEVPVARVSTNKTSGEAPLTIQFTGNQSSDDKAITSYFWDFKNGATSTNANPSHTFTQPGSYNVNLTVKDAEGESSTKSVTINVTAPAVNNTPPGFYVATNGNTSNNGTSPSSPWSLEYAFSNARPGDVVYVKAGNYGNKQLLSRTKGTSSNPVKFIGYRNSPGDIVSNQGSTFNYGESVSSSKMPLLTSSNGVGVAMTFYEGYVEIENFQITGYEIGVQTISAATNLKFKNIIVTKVGNQNSNVYKGFGFDIKGNSTVIENCFVHNAGAEAFKLSGASNSRISYSKAYGDNYSNPTDYYFLVTGGTNNAIIENSHAERAQEISHPGHGIALKDLAQNNVIRNCTVKYTKLELNFSGVKNNIIDNCKVIGRGTSSGDWEAAIVIKNGANNNLIKNSQVSNANWAINLADDDDGYVGPGGDRDEVSLGYNNTFDNLTVNNVYQMLKIGGGNEFSAKASNYTFKNCKLQNFEVVAVTYYRTENFKFQNCSFINGNRLIIEFDGQYAPYSSFNPSWENCTWSNVNFTPPN